MSVVPLLSCTVVAADLLDLGGGVQLAASMPPRTGRPFFTAPTVLGCSPGRPFAWRLPLAGARPMRFTVHALPQGLALDTESGVITGIVTEAGDYPLALTASNNLGSATVRVTLRVAEDCLLLAPLMGWTSWNSYGETVSQAKLEEAARLLDEAGFADLGYAYVNLDSGWQGRYGDNRYISPNAKFPDTKAMVDAIHARGLKAGIYSSPMLYCWGGEALPGCTQAPQDPKYARNWWGIGKIRREVPNAEKWAEWGFDYLKYDWAPCDPEHAEAMKAALRKTGRDIAFCVTVEAGLADAATWKRICTSWRDNEDSKDSWRRLKQLFTIREKDGAGKPLDVDAWLAHVSPGHYYDLDMLECGPMIWNRGTNRLSRLEQHFGYTLRVIWRSPLQLSCRLDRLGEFDRALLMNPEVIAVHQDAGDFPLVRLDETDGAAYRLYARELSNGRRAVAGFNLSDEPQTITYEMERQAEVRDVWARQELGRLQRLELTLPPHGARLLVY